MSLRQIREGGIKLKNERNRIALQQRIRVTRHNWDNVSNENNSLRALSVLVTLMETDKKL